MLEMRNLLTIEVFAIYCKIERHRMNEIEGCLANVT